MIQKIANFSVHNRLIVLIGVLALSAWGIYSLTRLPIDAIPDITDDQVQILTVSPSLGATDVERLITFPVEQACANTPRLKQIRSFSRFGLSVVTVVFEEGTDIYWARQQISERLLLLQGSIDPSLGTPQLGPITSGLGEIYQYVIRNDSANPGKYSAVELRSMQDWIVRRRLLNVKGVADVSSFGGLLKQYEVEMLPEKMKAFAIGVDDIEECLLKNNSNAGGAYIEKGKTLSYIRSEGLLESKKEIENLVIKSGVDGHIVRLKDVAQIKDGHAIPNGALCYNGDCDVSGAVVMMLKGENSSAIIKDVKKSISEINASLPEGAVIEPFLDRTKMVDNAISTVKVNLAEGALIVFVVLFLFLGNMRAALLVASIIPLAMLFAVSMMHLFGVSGNLMSLGALDFGLLIDGAVIIVESILFYFMQHKGEEIDPKKLTVDTASKMLKAAIFGQLIILVVYLPIFSLQGIEGKMFKPMAQTVSFALIGAFILSLTYVPMMSAWILKIPKGNKMNFADKWEHFLQGVYKKFLLRVIHKPRVILASALLLFIPALWMGSGMGAEFIPTLEEGDFAVETRLIPGSNLESSKLHSQKITQILLQFPEVEKIVSKIGSSEIPTDPMPPEASDIIVVLKDKKEWETATTFPALADSMNKALSLLVEADFSFQFPVQMRFNELLTGAKQDVVIKIFGENLDSLANLGARIAKIVDETPGTYETYVERIDGMPQTVVKFDPEAMSRYGVKIADANKMLSSAFAGLTVGKIYEGERNYDVSIRLPDAMRTSIKQIEQLPIPGVNGNQIPLYLLAEVKEEMGYNQIQRENAQRRFIVGFNVKDRDVQSVVSDIQQRSKSLSLPEGYFIRYGGSFENLQEASSRLAIAFPVALLLIFFLLYIAFGSVKQSLLVYSAIPLSSIGGILALWLRDMPFSISAGIGFIALFGVAVLNGVVLVSEINRLKKQEISDHVEAVVQACVNRIRPVLLTASVAALGFIPMALSNGSGAEVQRPLATVVIGGLFTSTLLTLIVLPVLFVMKSRLKKSATLVLFLAIFFPGYAQKEISIEESIQILQSKSQWSAYSADMQKALRQLPLSSLEIPETEFQFNIGHINSAAFDNGFALQQNIKFPAYYAQTRARAKSEMQLKSVELQQEGLQYEKWLNHSYYLHVWLKEQMEFAAEMDSIWKMALKVEKQRVDKGESDKLTLHVLQMEAALIETKHAMWKQEMENNLYLFNALLDTQETYIPKSSSFPTLNKQSQSFDLNIQQNTLRTALLKNQYRTAQWNLAPSLLFGYSNMTIIGYQNITGTEVYYDGRQRFGTWQVGLGIPLFQMGEIGEKKKLKWMYSAIKKKEIWDNQLLNRQKNNRLNVLTQYQIRYTQLFETLETESDSMLQLIFIQREKGEIGFNEWFLYFQQYVKMKEEMLQKKWEWMQAIIEYNYIQKEK